MPRESSRVRPARNWPAPSPGSRTSRATPRWAATTSMSPSASRSPTAITSGRSPISRITAGPRNGATSASTGRAPSGSRSSGLPRRISSTPPASRARPITRSATPSPSRSPRAIASGGAEEPGSRAFTAASLVSTRSSRIGPKRSTSGPDPWSKVTIAAPRPSPAPGGTAFGRRGRSCREDHEPEGDESGEMSYVLHGDLLGVQKREGSGAG